ncbi:MAG: TrkH family potassium uptake protein [Firmicutes bacterium]|nr:TrkH family potassium uptake protein [Bacillota bacterium]
MRHFRLFYLIGILLLFLSLTMVIPAIWSIVEQTPDQLAFIKAILVTAIFGGFFFWYFSKSKGRELSIAENFTLVTLTWFFAGIFGALPFHFYGVFNGSFIDAFFEAVSGFTTTGATLLADVESLPRGLLLWRAFTQWLGGMGIVVLFLAILPHFGFRSMTMFKAEIPGPIAERVVPRVVQTARRLWIIYVLLTVAQIISLMICGIGFFDALAHALTTMPTGGFSTYNTSVAAFNNPAAEIVTIIFMLFAGINFVLFFRLFRGDFKVFKDPELRFYLLVTATAIVIVTINLYMRTDGAFLLLLRQSAFQVVSIITTTGYATTNFDAWPHFSRLFLLMLMFIGACGGSTGGSIKQVRWVLMIRYSFRELYRLVHPSAISSVKLGEYHVNEEILRPVMAFGLLYFFLTALATLALTFMGIDLETALSAVASTLGNVGPGLAAVGPMHTYQIIPPLGKILLSVMMIIGRLEIFTVLVIFLPESRRIWIRALKENR